MEATQSVEIVRQNIVSIPHTTQLILMAFGVLFLIEIFIVIGYLIGKKKGR